MDTLEREANAMSHRLPFIFFALFVLIHDPAGDRVASYQGQNRETVASLISQTGSSFDFIDAATYQAFIAANKAVPLTQEQVLTIVHSEANGLAIVGADVDATLQRAAALVIMDELNILRQRDVDRSADVAAATTLADLKTRWASRSAFQQRTANQIQTAIQTKINAGSAD